MSIHSADDLRQLYHLLYRDVSRTINIPLRAAAMAGGAAAVRQRVLDFMTLSIQYDAMLPREEREILRQSLQNMLHALDDNQQHIADPPNNIAPATVYSDNIPRPARARATRRGRPRKDIDPAFLRTSLLHRSATSVAANLSWSARTVRRRALAYKIANPHVPVFLPGPDGSRVRNRSSRGVSGFTAISDVALDNMVATSLVMFPSHGRRLLIGVLRDNGIKVQKSRVRASVRRVTGRTRRFRKRVGERGVYRVAGPNSLWHHDGQHGLIRWKIVIHAFIDGYSRYVLGIRASDNNRANTVLDVFEACRHRTGATPHRCRGDCGFENLRVAERMAELRGVRSYLWGRSVDNIRIERLWVDVARAIVNKWHNFFHELERFYDLDTGNPAHIWLVHHLFLQTINDELSLWADQWNSHPMDIHPAGRDISRHTAESPLSMYVNGMIRNGLRGYDLPAPDGAEQVNEADLPEYGIDWEALQQRDILRSHHRRNANVEEPGHFGTNAPTRFSRIDVLPPNCPLSPEEVLALNQHVDQCVDLDNVDMAVRRTWWIVALSYLRGDHV